MELNKRIKAYISIDNARYNIKNLYDNVAAGSEKPPLIMPVIKADGYGHGALPIALSFEEDDCVWGYAVATAGEAFHLREGGIKKPILILGYSFPEDYEELIRHEIRPAVFKYETALALSKEAVKQGKKAYVHIKADTGMGRIGYVKGEAALKEICEIAQLPGIETEGFFTHFAKADTPDDDFTLGQIDRFTAFRDDLKARGVSFKLCHCLNSAGIIRFPGFAFDMVRSGITTYGLYPSEEVSFDAVSLKPVMELKTKIVFIKSVEALTPISYGGTFVSDRKMLIATIPVGYADGMPRALSNKGSVLIRGHRAPVLGRVCMDQFMVDVTDIPGVSEGDDVTLIGRDKDDIITFEEWQRLTGLLNYELACHISNRVERVMV